MASAEGLTRIMEVLADAEMKLRDAVSKKILVEVALLKSIEARNAMSIDSVLKQLQTLREGAGGEVVSIPQAASAPASVPHPKPSRAESTPASGGPRDFSSADTASQPEDSAAVPVASEMQEQPLAAAPSPDDGLLGPMWNNLLEAVGRASQFTRSYLLEAHPVSFKNNLLVIGFAPEFADHLGLVDNPRNHTLLQTKLSELGHPNSQIKFVKAEAPAGRERIVTETPPPTAVSSAPKPAPSIATARSAIPQNTPAKDKLAPVPFSKDDFKNDPLIQKALEIFKGQIVEVRA
jgi:DNA polymerase-3 subunit gamma/tau